MYSLVNLTMLCSIENYMKIPYSIMCEKAEKEKMSLASRLLNAKKTNTMQFFINDKKAKKHHAQPS